MAGIGRHFPTPGALAAPAPFPRRKPDADAPIVLIIEATATRYGLTRRDILSGRRAARLAGARQVAMWLARQKTLYSYPAIARAFRRDHTTVMYGVSRTAERMAGDADFAERVIGLAAAIGEFS